MFIVKDLGLEPYMTVDFGDGEESCILVPVNDYYDMVRADGEASAYRKLCEKLIEKM